MTSYAELHCLSNFSFLRSEEKMTLFFTMKGMKVVKKGKATTHKTFMFFMPFMVQLHNLKTAP